MNKPVIEDLLGDFSFLPDVPKERVTDGRPVTIWLPLDAKAKYDKLQEKSGQRFSKKVREILIELMSLAEQRIL